MNAQKQKGQALNAASAQKAIDILKVIPYVPMIYHAIYQMTFVANNEYLMLVC